MYIILWTLYPLGHILNIKGHNLVNMNIKWALETKKTEILGERKHPILLFMD